MKFNDKKKKPVSFLIILFVSFHDIISEYRKKSVVKNDALLASIIIRYTQSWNIYSAQRSSSVHENFKRRGFLKPIVDIKRGYFIL